jgi:hypothetical protein
MALGRKHCEKNMILRSESSGRSNGVAVYAGRVARSSSSQFGTSLWGRGPQSLGSKRSLQVTRWQGVVARRKCISLGGERPSASFKVARGAVALRTWPDSPSANRPHQLRLRPEVRCFCGLVATSRPATIVSWVRERISSASSFAWSARHQLQYPCARLGSVPNKRFEFVPFGHPTRKSDALLLAAQAHR